MGDSFVSCRSLKRKRCMSMAWIIGRTASLLICSETSALASTSKRQHRVVLRVLLKVQPRRKHPGHGIGVGLLQPNHSREPGAFREHERGLALVGAIESTKGRNHLGAGEFLFVIEQPIGRSSGRTRLDED